MNGAHVLALIAENEEGLQIEYKPAGEGQSDRAHTLVALANAQGGYLLIGVSDTRTIIGVPEHKKSLDRCWNAARQAGLETIVHIEAVEVDATTTVLVVQVPQESLTSVYQVGGVFLRTASLPFALLQPPSEEAAVISCSKRKEMAVQLHLTLAEKRARQISNESSCL